ncbi:NADH-quinone oxidoreductase subunit L [Pantoea sp. SoEX]|uniref:NADH-quinone oxidoreductase subunit L n=1 Tax=Pantoea sp. SoEX TaxID=2576763 RepID=UPI00135CEF20|nr:NADH-quinone oxidoreductase subunit L [Pantoea sp. SoEX]MXP50883.1 NADH-quinone oxidoreductase subunit L [Pantoea sp. SoEX]
MNLIYLTIIFPFLGFLLLSFSNGYYSDRISALIGVGSIGLSGIITVLVGYDFFLHNQTSYSQFLWNWIHVNKLNISVKLILDGLSLSMLSVVTGIGFLIHLFSSWYMQGKEGYSRFFAYTNLFIASMIILILADNLLLMFLGWECVGFCSYLLIGFYYNQLKNCQSALKAFIITRIGDIFLIVALIIVFNQMGTLDFSEISHLVISKFSNNDYIIHIITLLLLAGAIGKSAQLPLQTWLPDAMVGPTPVSALIHAATMVTAGVYLIARTYDLFLLTPEVLNLVSIIGAITLILASCSAIVQTDVKRILAYSTMSQIGYMFLALGLTAWKAAIFHLITHAFFKALLFLSAGSLITSCNHQQNIFKMGGLKKNLPFLYICFLIGGASLSSIPIITAGFYSKKNIIFTTLATNNITLMLICLFGTLLTSIYTFRMIFTIFHGKEKIKVQQNTSINHYIPLIVLLLLSTCIGALCVPPLDKVFPENNFNETGTWILEIISSILIFIGILIAAILHSNRYNMIINRITNSYLGNFIYVLWHKGWGFDLIYDKLFVKTYLLIASIIRPDPLNILLNYLGSLLCLINKGLLIIENGYLRWYILSLSMGMLAIIILIFMV